MKRYHIEVTGIVQGVGFRPFVYKLAKALELKGWVNNTGSGVIIEAEGRREALEAFLHKLREEAPVLSHIKDIRVQEGAPAGYPDFRIMGSTSENEHTVFISPDVATCDDCTGELFNKADRRYLYPFINCTNCGPRFTIVKDVPYDRANTTMKVFPMCSECEREYHEPTNRRYHAQPVSCFDCGPEMQLIDKKGDRIMVLDPIAHAARLLAGGKIVAVKGLGGYHLVCDAKNSQAVGELRRRKIREEKPFAVMTGDYLTACRYCHVSGDEKRVLESVRRPIVLLKKREDYGLPEEIAPSNPWLGVMLPYTPVHLLLFNYAANDCQTADASGSSTNGASSFTSCHPVPTADKSDRLLEVLVMTSGNRSSEPIYYKDDEAFENLKDIADFFLTNNREIHTRLDDSVTRIFGGNEYMIRRSRGYVPSPVTCEAITEATAGNIPSVLAAGGELKSTFCMNRGKEFYISQHIGDLENYETLSFYEQGIEHYKRLFNMKPEMAAYDLHPEYLSTKLLQELNLDKSIAIQHHHAHIAACMAENDICGEVIGVAFDGTGYGEDGHLWGGEFFTGGYNGFVRRGQLEYIKMPGGEAAIKEPWRMAASYLFHTFGGNIFEEKHTETYLPGIEADRLKAIGYILAHNINSPLTSSMGRLFDAVSALLGIRYAINYEGQAAIELEFALNGKPIDSFRAIADSFLSDGVSYPFNLHQGSIFTIDLRKIIKGVLNDRRMGMDISVISARFHNTVSDIVLRGCVHIREKTGLKRVALSGGVFQNITLLAGTVNKLKKSGFEVYTHSRVPANDGGISLGQAAMAVARFGG